MTIVDVRIHHFERPAAHALRHGTAVNGSGPVDRGRARSTPTGVSGWGEARRSGGSPASHWPVPRPASAARWPTSYAAGRSTTSSISPARSPTRSSATMVRRRGRRGAARPGRPPARGVPLPVARHHPTERRDRRHAVRRLRRTHLPDAAAPTSRRGVRLPEGQGRRRRRTTSRRSAGSARPSDPRCGSGSTPIRDGRVREAIRVIRALEDAGLPTSSWSNNQWQQPTSTGSPHVTASVDTRVMADESVFGAPRPRRGDPPPRSRSGQHQAGQVRRAQSTATTMVRLAEAHGIGWIVGSMMEGPIGVGAAASLAAAFDRQPTATSTLHGGWPSRPSTAVSSYAAGSAARCRSTGLGIEGLR